MPSSLLGQRPPSAPSIEKVLPEPVSPYAKRHECCPPSAASSSGIAHSTKASRWLDSPPSTAVVNCSRGPLSPFGSAMEIHGPMRGSQSTAFALTSREHIGRTRITTLSLERFIVLRSSILALFSVAFRLSSTRPLAQGRFGLLAGSETLPASLFQRAPAADFGLGAPAARPEAGFGFRWLPAARAAGEIGLGSLLGLSEAFSGCSSMSLTLHALGASTMSQTVSTPISSK
eukprot:scaffold53488_cov63-Phaeocystis_antarctica.AAC.2